MFPLRCALLGGADLGRHTQNWQGEGSSRFKAGCLPSNAAAAFLRELCGTGSPQRRRLFSQGSNTSPARLPSGLQDVQGTYCCLKSAGRHCYWQTSSKTHPEKRMNVW